MRGTALNARSLTAASLLVASLLGISGQAFAQSDEQRAGARTLATEGAQAFNESRFKDAVDLFSKAESLVHAPPHLLFMARAHAKLEHGTRSVVVFNLHLGLSGSERASQLERFLECHPFAHLHHETPIVVGGDFNDVWASLGQRFLEPAGFVRAGKLLATFPAALPLRPLDGLWVRGNIKVISAHPVKSGLATSASDHLPIVADLEVTAAHHEPG